MDHFAKSSKTKWCSTPDLGCISWKHSLLNKYAYIYIYMYIYIYISVYAVMYSCTHNQCMTKSIHWDRVFLKACVICGTSGFQSSACSHQLRQWSACVGLAEEEAGPDHKLGQRRPDSSGDQVPAQPRLHAWLCWSCSILQHHPFHQGQRCLRDFPQKHFQNCVFAYLK